MPGVIGVQSSRACALHIAAKSQTGRANRVGQQQKSETRTKSGTTKPGQRSQDNEARTTTKEEQKKSGTRTVSDGIRTNKYF